MADEQTRSELLAFRDERTDQVSASLMARLLVLSDGLDNSFQVAESVFEKLAENNRFVLQQVIAAKNCVAYLKTVLRNEAILIAKRRTRAEQKHGESFVKEPQELELFEANREEILDGLTADFASAVATKKIRERDFEMLRRKFTGDSQKEIADSLGLDPAYVSRRIKRTLTILR